MTDTGEKPKCLFRREWKEIQKLLSVFSILTEDYIFWCHLFLFQVLSQNIWIYFFWYSYTINHDHVRKALGNWLKNDIEWVVFISFQSTLCKSLKNRAKGTLFLLFCLFENIIWNHIHSRPRILKEQVVRTSARWELPGEGHASCQGGCGVPAKEVLFVLRFLWGFYNLPFKLDPS